MSARTIHPFPARMAPEIATDYIRLGETNSSLRILDPMCGSGTVLSMAVQRGHNATGIDIDPLAVLMSNVAVASTPEDLAEHARTLSARVQASDGDDECPGWHDLETAAFAQYWFAPKQLRALGALSMALARLSPGPLKSALEISLSRIIVTKSPGASRAADTSHSRPHRVVENTEYDVFDGFVRSANRLETLLHARSISGTASAELGDSRALTQIESASVDLTITSPPYLNAIDYMRGHKMSLIWLGYTIQRLRQIRSDSIGAERALAAEGAAGVETLLQRVKTDAANPDVLPYATLKRYSHDLISLARELHRVTTDHGTVVAVVGNSSLRGNYIDNGSLMGDAMQMHGFQESDRFERELPANRRYMPTTANSALEKRMRSELVLVFRRPVP